MPERPASVIDYPALLRGAVLGVVRGLLVRTAEEGLPGAHHFYLTFATDAQGVDLPAPLRKRYPKEMTIVLEQQFWDLQVGDEDFGVTLRFGGTPQRLTVPFAALTAFADPSVPFGVRLAESSEGAAPADAPPASKEAEHAAAAVAPVGTRDGPSSTGVVVDFKPRKSRQ